MGSQTSGNWKELAQICVKIQQDSIPKQWMLSKDKLPSEETLNVSSVPYDAGTMSAEELEMTAQDAGGLLKAYESGRWTVKQVITAFLKRGTVMQQMTNFATEFLAESALQKAEELDAQFKETGKLSGPLHGIPVSVKEHIGMDGHITHAGFVSKIGNVPKEDALSIQLLKKAGAVIHVRTNQPQSLMHLDSNNNITGMTLNPLNLKLSPGGSSGGEGVSVGSKCSVIGVGTDIGGSVRAPAAFNGCYGLRPTALRVPNLGNFGITAGQESIRGVVGPLGQSVEDLELFMSAILGGKPWDVETMLVPIEWRKLAPNKEMTVGILYDDGIVKPHPPMVRALKIAAEKLNSAGIKVVNWEPFEHQRGWDIVSALYFPQGPSPYLDTFAETGEPVLPLTQHAFNFSSKEPLTIAENWSLNYQKEAYRREYHALMKERGVDFILCPAYPGAGVLQGMAKYWNYTAIWNILDQPASIFPSGVKVDKDIDRPYEGYTPRNGHDEWELKAYDPELMHGFPVCLQLAGKHFHDEEVLQASKLIDAILKK
ncbi:amidase [Pseudomassariella vexata]|uniref:amidase n=1 Tax=Pseudomassariella vexata TaxID=1141098 RepID=A0A1Y2DL73_9PEZI|nr:amidase [Pseudomassariella vexata]ORY59987.1 amidase [Pseudomassariella vexata]